jgi:hypothetical protein
MTAALLAVLILTAAATSTMAQEADLEARLCEGYRPGDFFRLSATTCRDVYACTSEKRLHALRCPSGLAFDIERQTCDWADNIHNCHELKVSQNCN